ncbi:MAG: sulfatase-like hydrolase/transferase, partial [Acidobacteriaceae bacterium]
MNRREFLKTTGVVGAASLMEATAGAEARKPKQMVLILGESVRADMLNCYRHTGLRTPNLDRLASQGIRFDKAYNCQPVCAPARSGIWTGLFPHTNGVWGNSMPLGDTVHTLGQHLHDRGVHCAFVGKWHLDGVDYFGTGRPAPGWDPKYWYDMRDYLTELSPEDRVRSRKMSTGEDPSWTADYCYGHRCANRALDFLAKHKGEDYLLVLAFDEPHDPSLCPKEYSDSYKDFIFPSSPNEADPLTDKPAEQRIWAGRRLHGDPAPIKAHQFFGSHTFVDHEIGRVLDEIEKSAPDAAVLYTSDHGVFLGSHRLEDKGPAMYDEITRIPFIVKWPGVAPESAVCPHLVSHVDVSGTVIDYFGHSVPKTMEGTSMLSTFRDPTIAPHTEIFIEWGRYEVDHDGFGAFQPIRCVRDSRYKLSIHLETTDELYDLEADPGELNNLIDSAEHAAKRNELHDKLLNWMNVSRDPFRGY